MANSAAVIGAPTVSDVTEDTNLQVLIAAGLISISDANAGQAAFKTTVISASGNLGTLTIAANGAYSYSVADSAVQYLGAGDTKIDTFTVTSVDGTTKKVSFTIHGVNDAAVIGNATVHDVTEDATRPNLVATGSISISDVDQGEASFKTSVISSAGNLGTLTLSANGSYSYSVANSTVQYLGAGDTKVDTFTVTSLDGTTKQISFTIHGVNDAAVIGAPTVHDVTEDATNPTLTANGMISITDADQGQAAFKTTVISAAGNLGSLTLAANGSYSYSVADSAVQYLGAGATKVDTFTVTSLDGTTKQVSFTIHGTNDAAVIGTPTVHDVTEDATQPLLYAIGTISISDADQGEAAFQLAIIAGAGTLGALVLLPNGSYAYVVADSAVQYLGANDTKIDTFTIKSVDGTSKQISFTIHGTNDVAVIGNPTVHDVTEDSNPSTLTATGSISISDADQNQSAFQTTVVSAAGNLGTLTLAANGSYSYTVANSATQYLGASATKTDTFTIASVDGTTKQVTFTIHGVNDAAVIGNPSVQDITADPTKTTLTATGSISISDVDQGQASFKTSVASASGNIGTLTLASNGSYSYSVAESKAAQLGTNGTKVDTFTVTSFDGTTKQVTFTVHGPGSANHPATIGDPTVHDVTEDMSVTSGNLTAIGSISISDPDAGQAAFQTTTTAASGTLGSLVLSSTGSYTYSVANSAVQYLGATDTKLETFTVTSVDGTSKQVTFTIHGTNDAAVITGTSTVTLTETNAILNASGSLSATDIDSSAAFNPQSNVAGNHGYGHFAITSTGVWSYATDTAHNEFVAGQTYTDSFTVTTADGTSQVVTVSIVGTNDAAVITGTNTANLTETDAILNASGSLSATDIDSSAAFNPQSNVAGNHGYGHFAITSTGGWSYATDTAHNEFVAGQTYTDSFTATTADGTSQVITVSIVGTNDAAVITGTNTASLTETNATLNASGSLSATDVDSSAAFTPLSNVAGNNGYGHFAITSTGAWTYVTDTAHNEFVAGQSYTDSFTVTTADGTSQVITVSILGTNDAAVITGTNTASLTETDAVLSASGSLSATDVDSSAAFNPLSNVAGNNGYGHFAITSTGAWTYVTDTAHNEFVAGQSYTDSFTVTTADGTSQLVTVSILGTDDAPVVSPVTLAGGTEGSSFVITQAALLSGVTDIDSTSLSISSLTLSSSGGSLHDNGDHTWTYTPDAYQHGQISFAYTASDGTLSASSTASLAIAAVATQPVVTTARATASVGQDIALSIAVTDPDTSDTLASTVTISGVPNGQYKLNVGNPNDDGVWTVNQSDLGNLKLQYVGTDPQTASTITLHVSATSTDGTSSASTTQDLNIQISDPGKHYAVDGYISDALVFVDANGNGILDNGELSTYTAADGSFTLDTSGGAVILQGVHGGGHDSRDVLTGLAFNGVLKAPTGSTVVTPLTTLIVAVAGTGSVSAAEATVKASLGLSSTVDLKTLDPVAGTLSNAPGAAAVLAASIQVQATVTQLAAATGASADQVVSKLATQVSSNSSVDLGDSNAIQALATAVNPSLTQTNLTAISSVVSESNASISSGISSSTDLTGVAQASQVAFGSTTQALSDAQTSGTGFTQVASAYTGEALAAKIAAAPLTIVGTAASDVLVGGAGDDTLSGLGGNDTLTGGAGDDHLDGGAGMDIASYASATAGVTVDLTAGTAHGTDAGDVAGIGNDTLVGIEQIVGSNFADTFTAAGFTGNSGIPGRPIGFNDFEGKGGDDTIVGTVNASNQILTRISYVSADAGVTVDIAAGTGHGTAAGDAAHVGNDTFTNVNSIVGSAYNDTLLGSNNPNGTFELFEGRGGNDYVDGRGGYDMVAYNNDPTTTTGINVQLAAGIVTGDATVGTDTLRSVEAVRGTKFADVYDATGFSGASTNAGSNGTFNNFDGQGGDDIIIGNGNTRLQYSQSLAAVTVDLTAGTAHGTAAGDIANVGNDTFTGVNAVMGSMFDDTLLGSAGNDTFQGLAGNDYIDGRGGFDIAQYNNLTYVTGGVSIDLASGVVIGDASNGTDTLRSIEGIQGTFFNDTYVATGYGVAGALNVGNNGNFNQFEGAGGNDTITGNGNTRIGYFSANAGVTVVFTGSGSGYADGDSSVGHDTFTGVNSVSGSAFADSITGDGNSNTITGGGGNDTIDGGGGADLALFTGARGGYTITFNTPSAGKVQVQDNTAGRDGTDTLTNVEIGQFSDQSVLLASGTSLNPIDISDSRLFFGATTNPLNVLTGTNNDFVKIGFSLSGHQINLGGGTGDTVILGQTGFYSLNLVNVENVIGSSGNDTANFTTNLNGLNVDLGGGTGDFVKLANGTNTLSVTNVETINATDFSGAASNDTLNLSNNVSGLSVNLAQGTNTLNLAAGANSFVNINSVDTINGTGSDDTLTVTNGMYSPNNDLLINLGGGNDTVVSGSQYGSFALSGVEHLVVTGQTDSFYTLTNNQNGLSVDLGAGNTGLQIAAGVNTLSVTNVQNVSTSDFVGGSPATDDTLTLQNDVTGVTIGLGQGNNTLNLAAGANAISVYSVQTVNGSALDDSLTLSNSSGVTVDLGGGTDTLTLSGGFNGVIVKNVENVVGGTGNDSITIADTTGTVTVTGGLGNDFITLGGSHDNVRFTQVADSGTASNTDTVNNFDAANDTFVFDHVGGLVSGIHFMASGILDGTQAEAILNGNMLEIDVDGDGQIGAGDMAIFLNGLTGTLTDANFVTTGVDHRPTDIQLSAASVAENSANGTVVGALSATDPDAGDTATYSLTDSAGGLFAISGNNLVVNGPINYEATQSLQVTVRVTDSGGLSYDKNFTIGVTDVNEAPTDISLSANSIAQGSANGTVIGSLSAIDPDFGDTSTFTLLNNAGGQFAISGNNIVVAGPLTSGPQQVTVRDIDAGGLFFDKILTINVGNSAPIIGDAGNNSLVGTAGDDTLQGLGGNDRLQGLGGNDMLDGGIGFDRAVYSDATAGINFNLASGTVNGAAAGVGTDTLIGIEGIVGTAFNDTFDATGFTGDSGIPGTPIGFNEFEGGAGNDTITALVNAQGALLTRVSYAGASAGVTVDLSLGTGHGTAAGDVANVGTDTFIGNVGNVIGSQFGDTLIGSNNASGTVEVFDPRAGNDTINGGGGFDRVDYNNDPSVTAGITVNMANGTVVGDSSIGSDTLRSVEAARGTNFADTYIATGFSGTSTNAGSLGTFNEFTGNGGDDIITGNGNTRLSFNNATAGVTVNIAAGTASGDASVGHDTFTGVNAVMGSMFNDTITGSGNTASTETFTGLAGDDFIDGGAGFDISSYNNLYYTTGSISVNMAAGTVVGDASTGTDTLRSIEGIQGTNFNDTYDATGFGVAGALNIGNNGTFNQFEGVGGNDTITGNGNTRAIYANATGAVTIAIGAGGAGSATGDASTGTDTFTGGVNSAAGSNFNDSYNASAYDGGFNSFQGSGGNDTITGNGFTQVQYSNATAGVAITIAAVGAGSASGDSSVGTDTFISGVNSAIGSNFADTYNASTFNGGFNSFQGNAGNDTITGNGFTQILYSNATASVNVNLATGTATGDGSVGADTIIGGVTNVVGSNFNDTITGSSGNDILNGNGGNDTINGGAGADNLTGGLGADTFVYADGGGADFITDFTRSQGDRIDLTGVAGVFSLADVQSHATQQGPNAFIDFGGGNTITLANVTVGSFVASDFVFASVNTVVGTANNDTLVGTSGVDNIQGLDGNDRLQGLAGNDILDGGNGFDRAVYSDATAGINFNLASGTVNGNAAGVGTDTLVNIEGIVGTNFADTFTAAGFTGSSTQSGVALGQSSFEGGGGDDVITGQINSLGQAVTRVEYLNASAAVTVDLAAGTAQGTAAGDVANVGHDTLINIQGVFGSAYDDTIYGSNNANFTYEVFEGRGGNDYIDGRGGYDIVAYNNDPTTTSGITVNLAAGTVTGDATVGTDTLRDIEAVRGTNFNDVFDTTGYGAAGALNVSSTNGSFNDIAGAGGDDLIIGNGNTRLNYSIAAAAVTVDLETSAPGTTNAVTVAGSATGTTEGTDTFTGVNAVQASMFNDTLYGSIYNNTFTPLGGDDYMDGRGGFDTVSYNSLNTVTGGITVNMAAGTITGDASIGNDTIRNIEGVQGTGYADSYDATGYGVAGALNISTSNGNFNQFEGLGGNDTITGNGNTRAIYSNATGAVAIVIGAGGAGSATGDASTGTDTFTGGVNSAMGSNFADSYNASAYNGGFNSFQGSGGNDTITGNGFTQVQYSNATAGVTITIGAGGAGSAAGDSSVGTDTFIGGVNSAIGGNFADTYNASAFDGGFNQFQGNAGNDTITGNGATQILYSNATAAVNVNLTTGIASGDSSVGTDTITGGVNNVLGSNFNDTITGSSGNDFLSGNGGNDTLSGGAGADNLTGGLGADTFVYADGGGADFIADFTRSQGDRIDLTGVAGVFSLADVQSHATQQGANAFIDFGGGNTITLANVTVASFVASDFVFGSVNTIVGTSGIDTLVGTSGPDNIQGLDGNDRLQGLGGNDTLNGGTGFDRAVYSDATAGITFNLASGTVNGSAAGVGTDALIGIEGIVGTDFADTFNATGFTGDTLVAGTQVGFNEFEGRGGNDTITGAVNSQGALLTRISYVSATGSVTVDLQAGTAVGDSSVGSDTLVGSGFGGVVGSAGNDTLLGSNNGAGTVEVFEGRGGNDTINGRGGFDRADYALDPTTTSGITVNMAAGTVTGDSTVGTDTLLSVESVRGTNFADTYTATGFSGTSTNAGSNGTFNEFNGMGGNDTIIGNGNTRITYLNATGGVTVDLQTGSTPGTGTATGDASTGTDTFSGVNAVYGSMFNDTIRGSNSTANETFYGGAGDDFIDGRGGFDIVTYNNIYFSTGAVTVNMGAGTATGDASIGNDTLRSIESIQGTNFNDVYDASTFGTASALNIGNNGTFNQFEGLGGNDTITGNGATRISYASSTTGVSVNMAAGTASGDASIGNDTFTGVNSVFGSAGADTYVATGFVGGVGAFNSGTFNIFEGLAGNDTITGNGNTRIGFTQATAAVTVNLATGTATGDSSVGTDTITGGVNSVQGSNFNDTLTGSAANESFFGGSGNDTINAGGGNDQITGQAGNDTIDGGAGTDVAIYTGAMSAYTISSPSAGQTQVLDSTATRDGTDILTNVEVLEFTDTAILLASGSSSSPIDISTINLNANISVAGTGSDDYLLVGGNIFGHQIDLGGGNDTVMLASGGFYTLNLAHVENVTGSIGDDTVSLTAVAAGLAVDLGNGNDNLNLANGSNTLSVSHVENINSSDFSGAVSNDTLTLLNDVSGLTVGLGQGDNTLNLAAGSNSFVNIFNVQHINGSASDDSLTVTNGVFEPGNNPTIDLGAGDNTLHLGGGGTFTLLNVQHLTADGTDGSVTLNNDVTGLSVDLGGGNDLLNLATGTNSVSVANVESIGSNDWTGAASNDTLTLLNNVSGGLTVNLQQGSNTLNLAAGANTFDNLYNIDHINGSSSDDSLSIQGNVASTTIDLGDGNDTLNLNGGSFGLTVANAETINGSFNFDTITISNAVTGNTTITAGAGSDNITASAGADNFRFTSVADSTNGQSDTITNFDAAHDTFTFAGITVAGGQIDYVGAGTFEGAGHASAVLQNFGPGNDQLNIDINGDGVMDSSDMVINLTNLQGTLHASNFLLA